MDKSTIMIADFTLLSQESTKQADWETAKNKEFKNATFLVFKFNFILTKSELHMVFLFWETYLMEIYFLHHSHSFTTPTEHIFANDMILPS